MSKSRYTLSAFFFFFSFSFLSWLLSSFSYGIHGMVAVKYSLRKLVIKRNAKRATSKLMNLPFLQGVRIWCQRYGKYGKVNYRSNQQSINAVKSLSILSASIRKEIPHQFHFLLCRWRLFLFIILFVCSRQYEFIDSFKYSL